MSSTKSIGYFTLLLVLMLIQATLQTPVNALDFEGDYKFLTVSPSVCATYSCNYRCALAYKITVSGATATLYPTTNPSGCVCETLFATIIGDTATGMGSASVYSLKRTSTGLEVVAQVSSLVCIATYTATSSSSTTSPVTSPTGSITTSPVTSPTGSITSTTPASTTGSSIASTTSPTSGTTITRSGAAQSSGPERRLGRILVHDIPGYMEPNQYPVDPEVLGHQVLQEAEAEAGRIVMAIEQAADRHVQYRADLR